MANPLQLAGVSGAVIADAVRRSRDAELNAKMAAQRTGAPTPEELQRQAAAEKEAQIIAEAEAAQQQQAQAAQQQTQPAPAQQQQPALQQASEKKEEPKFAFPLDKYMETAGAVQQNRLSNRAKIDNAALEALQAGYPSEQVKAFKEASLANLAKYEAKKGIREIDPSEDGFVKSTPLFSDTVKKIQGEAEQRRGIINGLQAQLRIMDSAPPETDKKAFEAWSFDTARQLKGAMLSVVNGIMGTPNAVAEQEAKRLAPQLATDTLDLVGNLMKPGLSSKMPEVKKYKKMVADVYNHLVETDNKAYNQIATQSNPEFATRFFGAPAPEHPEATFKVTPRVSREAPSEKPIQFGTQAPGQQGGVRRRALVGGRFVDVQ